MPFEIGALRNQHMAARDRIRRWQAMLRDVEDFDHVCEQKLETMAAYLKSQPESLLAALPAVPPDASIWPAWMDAGNEEENQRGILTLAHELANILDRLWDEMRAAPLYAVK